MATTQGQRLSPLSERLRGMPEEEKKEILKARAEEKVAGGPAKNRRSQLKRKKEAEAVRRVGKLRVTHRHLPSLAMMG